MFLKTQETRDMQKELVLRTKGGDPMDLNEKMPRWTLKLHHCLFPPLVKWKDSRKLS